MQISQNDQERLVDMVQKGEMTADQANVESVRLQRVYLVKTKIPTNVRKALNSAVKAGQLGHLKKDGHKPEVYYHPTFDYLVAHERNEHERQVARALAGVLAPRTLEQIGL